MRVQCKPTEKDESNGPFGRLPMSQKNFNFDAFPYKLQNVPKKKKY